MYLQVGNPVRQESQCISKMMRAGIRGTVFGGGGEEMESSKNKREDLMID